LRSDLKPFRTVRPVVRKPLILWGTIGWRAWSR
jgi:hypothetical protein